MKAILALAVETAEAAIGPAYHQKTGNRCRCRGLYLWSFAAAHGLPRIANAMVKYEWR